METSVLDKDLFGTSPDERAIELIRLWEPEALKFSEEGYYLCFSGGKDSIVIEDLTRRAGVKHTAHYACTTIDPPTVYRFIKHRYPQVRIEMPEKSFFKLVVESKGLPTRQRRWCCSLLKEKYGRNRIMITGIRSQESPRRKDRPAIEACTNRNAMFLHPIKDWTMQEVWEYIKRRGLFYPTLYREGFKRIGCVVCPFESNKERSMKRWPHLWEAVRRAAYRRYAIRENEGYREKYGSAEGYWQWWLSGMAAKPDENQCTLFEGGIE